MRANSPTWAGKSHIDLGIGLMEYGICLYWGDANYKETNPDWISQKQTKPFECGMCFFLQRGHQKRHLPSEWSKTHA